MRVLSHALRYALRAFITFALTGIAVLLISLMLPVSAWRTGEAPAIPIQVQPAEPFTVSPVRVWIDTDAACGLGSRRDPDDCFAILLLARQDKLRLVGISTIFGNAAVSETDRTTRTLIDLFETHRLRTAPVYRGASHPLTREEPSAAADPQEAHEALRRALEREPLVIIALGPLTNVAIALKDRPDLQANVTRLVAVMGRRKGHVFHPVEGGTAPSFLGHGPIFRDFNVTEDERAVSVVISMGLPLALVPYEASRDVLLDRSTLNKMDRLGGPAAWVAQRAHSWLTYWREDIDIAGFYPFDLVAAAYVVNPRHLRCAQVPVDIEDDTWLFGWLGYRGLFVRFENDETSPPKASGTALYCPEVSKGLGSWLVDQLTSAPPSPSSHEIALLKR